VNDTKAAVRWLRANAKKYRLDPDAIGAIGGSAGAHLAVYLGVTRGLTKLEGSGGNQDMASSVSAVVALAPLTNFLSPLGEEENAEATVSPSQTLRTVSGKTAPPQLPLQRVFICSLPSK